MKFASAHHFLEHVTHRNPGQTEFHQAVSEVMESLWPFIQMHPGTPNKACWTVSLNSSGC